VDTVRPSTLLVVGFTLLPIALLALVASGVRVAGVRRTEPEARIRAAVILTVIVGVAWMAVSATAAASGILRQWNATPPPLAGLVIGIVTLASLAAFTSYGRRLVEGLALAELVAFQAFRLPLELLMHRASVEDVMPEVMSYTGRNLDILTGLTAAVLAPLVASGRTGRGVVMAWNVGGFGLLMNIVIVSILATPRFGYFGADQLNVWVTYPPFVWLPAVMVLAALAGHLLIFRKLSSRP
jgi:hypothetical protein